MDISSIMSRIKGNAKPLEEKYKIEVANFTSEKRFIDWCDDNWYSTSYDRGCRFTAAEVTRILSQLKRHYVYKVNVISESGDVKHHNMVTFLKPVSRENYVPNIRANPFTGQQVLDIERIMRERKTYLDRQEELKKKKQ